MTGNEVGKVGLGLEFVGDIGKQISEMAHEMGQRLAKAFGATLKGVDFSDTLKEAVKGATDFDQAMKGVTASIKEAEKSLDSMKTKLKDMVIPQIPASAVTPSNVSGSTVATKKNSKSTQSIIDIEATKAEIDHLTAVLDNINAKLEIQQGKLADLKQAYEETFNEAKKSKLQEQIVNLEGVILRLTKTSDQTASKIWKLEDVLNETENKTKVLGEEIQKTGKRLNVFLGFFSRIKNLKLFTKNIERTSQELKKTDQKLKDVAKSANRSGSAFASAGKRAASMGNQFTAAFKRIAKQVLIFSVLYKAIRGFQEYVSSSLKTNDEYAKSLAQVRMNLKAAFAPIFQAVLPAINALIKAMVTATTYVAAFVSALFGKTYKQSLQAAIGIDKARASLDKYGKSANKMAGFDELNLLDTSDGGDDGGLMSDIQAFEMPELDIDSIQTQMDALALGIRTTFEQAFGFIQSSWQAMTVTFGPSIQSAWAVIQPELLKWKEQFGAMFSGILMLGEPLKNWWQNDLMPLWNQSIIGLSSIFAGLSESVRMAFNSVWEAAFPIFEKFVADGLPKITEFVAGATEAFGQLFGVVKQVFDDIWGEAIDPVLQLISDVIRDTLDVIFEWWDTWGQDIVDRIKVSLEKIKELWDNLWNKMLKPIITKMLDKMKELWDNHLKDLVKEIGNFIGKLITAAQDIYNKFIAPIINWLVKILGPVVSEIFDGVIDVIGNALGSIADAAKGIIRALGGIIDFIAGVFTGDWKRAWDGIKTFFSGIGDAIGSIFKGAINMIIDALNWMIKQVNKISFDVPDWVPVIGGKKFGFNIPQIPRLAEGGLVTGPTLAWVGDNRHANVDPEVIAPLSKLQDMLSGSNQEIVDALYMIAQLLQDFARRPVILEANGTQLAKIIDAARDDRNRRAGRTLSMA